MLIHLTIDIEDINKFAYEKEFYTKDRVNFNVHVYVFVVLQCRAKIRM